MAKHVQSCDNWLWRTPSVSWVATGLSSAQCYKWEVEIHVSLNVEISMIIIHTSINSKEQVPCCVSALINTAAVELFDWQCVTVLVTWVCHWCGRLRWKVTLCLLCVVYAWLSVRIKSVCTRPGKIPVIRMQTLAVKGIMTLSTCVKLERVLQREEK